MKKEESDQAVNTSDTADTVSTRAPLKQRKSAALARESKSSEQDPALSSPAPDYNWASQGQTEDESESKGEDRNEKPGMDESGPDYLWNVGKPAKQGDLNPLVLSNQSHGIGGSCNSSSIGDSCNSVSLNDVVGSSTHDNYNGHTLSAIFAESHASHIFAEAEEEGDAPVTAIVRSRLKTTRLPAIVDSPKNESEEDRPCFRWESMGSKIQSTGCLFGKKQPSKESTHERRSRNAPKDSSRGNLGSLASKTTGNSKACSTAMALMASVDSTSTTKKSSRRAKGLKSTKSFELPPLRRVKSDILPVHEMRRIASNALAAKAIKG